MEGTLTMHRSSAPPPPHQVSWLTKLLVPMKLIATMNTDTALVSWKWIVNSISRNIGSGGGGKGFKGSQ